MKSFISVVLILLCGMLSLTGYSSTNTPTTRKMDIVEKAPLNFTATAVTEVSYQMVSVENQAIDVGVSSIANTPYNFENTVIIAENDSITQTQYTELVPGFIYERCHGHT